MMLDIIAHLLSINTVLYHFNLGVGYSLSYIEAVGTVLVYYVSGMQAKRKSLISILV